MELKLGGETFQCHDTVLQGAMLDLAEAIESGGRGLKAILGIGRFLRTAVLEEERERLEILLYRRTDPLTFADLNEATGELVMAYNGAPLDEPSSSGDGSDEIGEPSRVVSLSRGTVAEEKPLRKGGRSRVSST